MCTRSTEKSQRQENSEGPGLGGTGGRKGLHRAESPGLMSTRMPVCVGKAGATCPCAIRNEERRRAWRASQESKLQPLPSCEVW